MSEIQTHELRRPCKYCGEEKEGTIQKVGGQNVVRCANCGSAFYNAPKTETGEKRRSVSTVHEAVRTSVRAAVLVRSGPWCELCGKSARDSEGGLHVGHLLSVEDGIRLGLTEDQINGLENLAAMCEECNIGLSRRTVPLWLAVAIINARGTE